MYVSHDVDSGAVVDAAMFVALRRLPVIRVEVIGVDRGLGQDSFRGDPLQGLTRHVVGYHRNHAAFAGVLHDPHNHGLAAFAASGTALLATALPSHISFVHFYCGTLQSDVFRHQGSDLTEDAPRGFVGDAGFALNLSCGDAAAGRALGRWHRTTAAWKVLDFSKTVPAIGEM